MLPVDNVTATGRYDPRTRRICGQALDNGFDGWRGAALKPDWPKLHCAAEKLVVDLGIRRGRWIDALGILGHDQATIAVMITAERESLKTANWIWRKVSGDFEQAG